MEELQSTEVLDKEILEDARKKAFRTIKASDDAIKDATLGWEQKTQAALGALDKKFSEKAKTDGAEIMARLNLDKRRLRSAKIESLLQNASTAFIEGLSREKQLALLKKELETRLQALAEAGQPLQTDPEPSVYARLLTEEEVVSMLPAGIKWHFVDAPLSFAKDGRFPALVINTNKVKLTASLDAAVDALLQDKRGELTTALLGEDAIKEAL